MPAFAVPAFAVPAFAVLAFAVLAFAVLAPLPAAAQDPPAPSQLERSLGVAPGYYTPAELADMFTRRALSGAEARPGAWVRRPVPGAPFSATGSRSLQRLRRIDRRHYPGR